MFSDLLWADIDNAVLLEETEDEGATKFRPPLGPVGARKPAGPFGGDLGATGRIGDRSRGVDLAESLSLNAS